VDFKQNLAEQVTGVGYAMSYIFSEKDTSVLFGLSCGNAVKIWLNNQFVHTQKNQSLSAPKEISYNRFVFSDTLIFNLKKVGNKILVKSVGEKNHWIFFMRAITSEGDENSEVNFSLKQIAPEITSSNWFCIGVFPGDDLDKIFPPELEFKNFYSYADKILYWTIPKQNLLLELKIKDTNSFKRDSYIDWHYADGATMFGILALADATGENKYLDFVKKYGDFTVANLDYFKWQYEQIHAYRGSYHRIFRRTMLDDTGAPALPFLELFDRTKNSEYWKLIEPIADYILNQQIRLEDGTFCRPGPVHFTVWADDLFMSCPFLLRMGKITGDLKYFDDAARQIINFTNLLFDKEKKLFYHGWFSQTNQNSVAFWGRANGWVIWATSEALLYLPKNHPRYKNILSIYRRYVEGLVSVQDKNGMWHQVLNHPESYEETSCTAMFVLGIARAIQHGWIDKKYKDNAVKA
jgi:unsaturated rhamnogalacturonyl hydrolase